MRTVEDLRAALESLESLAPAVDDVHVRHPAATRPPRRRVSLLALPTAITAVAIVALLAVGVIAVSRSNTGTDTGNVAAGHAAFPDGGLRARLLPFRLTTALPQLSLATADATTDPADPSGTVAAAEYGSVVIIDVRTAPGLSAHSASATKVSVGGGRGWLDVTCGLRAGQTAEPANPQAAVNPFNPTCSLSYVVGPWHVAIYVAGPGGGYRKITSKQFLQIGNHLTLADSPTESSTWFPADRVLPD